MPISTRQQLIDYSLRALGAPVVDINISQEQIEDRIDEALDYFRLYHSEGVERIYLKHKIRASEMYLTTHVADTFELGEIVTGASSGATARVVPEAGRLSSENILLVIVISGVFKRDEVINGTSGASGTLIDIFLGEYDKKYIQLSDWIYGVVRILPVASTSSSKSLFDMQYQFKLNTLYDLTSTSIIYYEMVMQQLSLLDMVLNGQPLFEFNRLQGRVYPKINWDKDIILGDYMVFECYRALDPVKFNKVWNEPWLRHYVIALFKRQWGGNMAKFDNIQLPGGVKLRGGEIYDQALIEIKNLEKDLRENSAPLNWMVG